VVDVPPAAVVVVGAAALEDREQPAAISTTAIIGTIRRRTYSSPYVWGPNINQALPSPCVG
jgi:hypothetical protein